MSAAGGYVAAVGSAICNGSFGSISKIRRVQDAEIPFPIFSFWTCMGIVLSSLFFLIPAPRVFEPWGLLSGLFFVLSMAFTFLSISNVGLGCASGVWSGTSILVSFTWAIKVQGEKISSAGLAAPGIMLLVGGVVIIAFNGQVASHRREEEQYNELEDSGESGQEGLQSSQKSRRSSAAFGIAAAVIAGLFGGLVLGPMYYAEESHKGLSFIPSMALGVLICAPIVTAALTWLSKTNDGWNMHMRIGGPAGIASGFVWNAGNALSVVATTNPAVGLGVAYPIMQAGLFVGGLWGIYVFNELTMTREKVTYWVGGLILIGGAIMLAFSK